VEKLGAASMTLAIALRGPAGEERVRARLVVALMDLAKRRAVPIDDALRSRILPFCTIPG
jgi:acyl-CoA thioesterase FadM